MKEDGFLARQGFVRATVGKDLVGFAVPALGVFAAGLIVSGLDGYDGMLRGLWRVIVDPARLGVIPVANIIGLAVFVAGLTVAIVGAVTLGRSYAGLVAVRRDHRLVTHGIYRYVRNPIYAGVLLGCFSIPIYASSVRGALVMALLVPLFLYRIRLEEALLTEHFGEAYTRYRAQTKKLIPFVF